MAEEQTMVRVEGGLLRGRQVKSRAAGTFWSFKGVPYARPPVGTLRFKDAQPVEPCEGVRDAFEVGSKCTQFDEETHGYVGSEDCLYLNVYTPQMPEPGRSPLLPVMVYIHGGGFEFGCGHSLSGGPDYLVADGVVVVTFNYRLGVLGFLFLEEAAPGNAGLKDQVAALRWVQRNAAIFGGDPGNVTLFGTSAGGASVHMHMLSPMSKGLFQRAIAMSGAALNPWALQTEPAATTRRLARLLGCTSEDPHTIVDFLRGVDHRELVRLAHTHARPEKDRKRLVTFAFVPTHEVTIPGQETFMPAPAEQLMKEGRHHSVPYMTGFDENEAYLILAFVDILKENVAKELDSRWEENVLPELRLLSNESKNKEALTDLRNFFLEGKPLSKATMQRNLDMFSDIIINEGIIYALKSMTKPAKAPLFQYIFTVDDQFNFLKHWKKIDAPGAAHGDIMGYLFDTAFSNQASPTNSLAALTRRRVVRLWTNFAKTGNPTPDDDPLLGVQWKQYTEKEANFLEIGPTLKNGTKLYSDRMDFWEKFYATYRS